MDELLAIDSILYTGQSDFDEVVPPVLTERVSSNDDSLWLSFGFGFVLVLCAVGMAAALKSKRRGNKLAMPVGDPSSRGGFMNEEHFNDDEEYVMQDIALT